MQIFLNFFLYKYKVKKLKFNLFRKIMTDFLILSFKMFEVKYVKYECYAKNVESDEVKIKIDQYLSKIEF